MLVRQLAAIFGVFLASLIILVGALRADDAATPAEQPTVEAPTEGETTASEAPESDTGASGGESSAEEPKE